jgi:hypothetical protein
MAINNLAVGNTDNTLLLVPDPVPGWTPGDPEPAIKYAITTILVCNTWVPNPVHEEDGLANFDLHLIKRGETKANANKIINALNLPAGETFTFDSEKIVLESGDRVIIVGESPTVLSATISYLEV